MPTIDLARYQGYSQALDSLPQYAKEVTRDIHWSWRSGKLSLCWVTEDLDIFTEVCGGQIPDIVAAENVYYVDLESLQSGPVRMYTDYRLDPKIDIKGYYFASLDPQAQPTHTKVYKKTTTEGLLLVDRYEGDTLVSPDEREKTGQDPSIWTGPKELLDLVKSSQDNWWLIRKEAKDQSYIRVY